MKKDQKIVIIFFTGLIIYIIATAIVLKIYKPLLFDILIQVIKNLWHIFLNGFILNPVGLMAIIGIVGILLAKHFLTKNK